MRAGRLKHKIIIKSSMQTKNSFNELVLVWTDFSTIKSNIIPLNGNEIFSSSHLRAEVTHKVEIRYLVGVTPKMKIVYGSREFNIESVINVREANKVLHLVCTEVV